jgi:hypothetical protein
MEFTGGHVSGVDQTWYREPTTKAGVKVDFDLAGSGPDNIKVRVE